MLFSFTCLVAVMVVRAESSCHNVTSCGSCMAADPDCAWCMQTNYTNTSTGRCDVVDNLISQGCQKEYIVLPTSEVVFTKNETLRDSDVTEGTDAIQLFPQKMNIRLRPGTATDFNLTFRLANNFPVDLYVLMDFSCSMVDDMENLANLGMTLADEMLTITQDFQMGFGTFVDKETLPFVKPDTHLKLCNNMPDTVRPYSFKNDLPLNTDYSQYQTKLQGMQVSSPNDVPEGTLDAIMQTVKCKREIGWRDRSRKIIVVATDSPFHIAGFGKLGGVVKPNDGECHLVNNSYSESLNQDYPSISHLAHEIAESKIILIFAVVQKRRTSQMFRDLSSMIEGSVMGSLAEDSSNLLPLIKEKYEEIRSKVTLKVKSPPGINVTLQTKCDGTSLKTLPECDNLAVGEEVSFQVQVKLDEDFCDTHGGKPLNQNVEISTVGLADKLDINITPICACPCEGSEFRRHGDVQKPIRNSPDCNGNGTLVCGGCDCNEGYSGGTCQCDEKSCIKPDTSVICEGRGQCDCGRCRCNALMNTDPSKRYSGEFCECNNYNCDLYKGELCGGPSRGICECGVCKCKDAFDGASCNCPSGDAGCRSINMSSTLCSGHGACKCGKCECEPGYSGRFCQYCPSCRGPCETNRKCVECSVFNSGPYDNQQCRDKCGHVRPVAEVDKGVSSDNSKQLCRLQDADKCDFYFIFDLKTGQVSAQTRKVCPDERYLLKLVAGIVAGIIGIGCTLLMAGKAIVVIHDKKEYTKFLEERKNARWTQDNPIFKAAVSEFENPTFKD